MWSTEIKNRSGHAINVNGIPIQDGEDKTVAYNSTGVTINVQERGEIRLVEPDSTYRQHVSTTWAVKIITGDYQAYWGYEGNPTMNVIVSNDNTFSIDGVIKNIPIAINRASDPTKSMEQYFEDFLRGRLKSLGDGDTLKSVEFKNETQIPLSVSFVNTDGRLFGGPSGAGFFEPGKSFVLATDAPIPKNSLYIIFSALSGSFIGIVFASEIVTISNNLFRRPNNIGFFPIPTKSSPIPDNSPRILVGCGKTSSGNIIIRDQFWQRGGDSYVLAPGQTKTVSYTYTSGIQQVSSEQEVLSKSLGIDVAAGWGSISASLSASLNQQSTTYQQFTVHNESTYFESLEMKNDSTETRMFLKWALSDVITIFDKTNNDPIASVVNIVSPVLIGGPYNPANIPD